jgi:phage shock protein A
MFKQILTLVRGTAHEAAAGVVARRALVVLGQQSRDAAAAIRAAQRGLAMAVAADAQEQKRLEAMAARIAGLEARARAAMAGGREDLAMLAAGGIAVLEMDSVAAAEARVQAGRDILQLRRRLSEAERRFAALERGRRQVQVGEAVARLQGSAGLLEEAEATLDGVRFRHAAMLASPEMQLDEAGFGLPMITAESVLARLTAVSLK